MISQEEPPCGPREGRDPRLTSKHFHPDKKNSPPLDRAPLKCYRCFVSYQVIEDIIANQEEEEKKRKEKKKEKKQVKKVKEKKVPKEKSKVRKLEFYEVEFFALLL